MSTAEKTKDSARVAILKRRLKDLQWFYAYIDSLTSAGDISADDFSAIVQKATEDFDIDRQAMAGHFSVNKGTISRWANGQSAPQTFARPTVFSWLRSQVGEREQDVQSQLCQMQTQLYQVN